MADLFNEKIWRQEFKKPDWYLKVLDDFKNIEEFATNEKDYSRRKAVKAPAYEFIEHALENGEIHLGESGKNFDAERLPVDTVVIHHTDNKPGMSLARLNAIQLLRIYAAYYENPAKNEAELKGQPIWSGHFYFGRQVFWSYHWLVMENGELEHILEDEYIGWHSGNWEINKRSIGICIDDILTEKEPSAEVLGSIARLIKACYPRAKIIGHREVNPKTQCPGDLFLSGWKAKLIKLL